MDYIIPSMMTKTIKFRRLSSKNVKAYEINAIFKDENYESGLRNELLDTIENPYYPVPVLKIIELAYNDNATWEIPKDALIDRDHKFRLFLKRKNEKDYAIMNSITYAYNRITRLFTLDTVMIKYEAEDKLKLEYWQDIIVKTYPLTEDCMIKIRPVFKEGYTYGDHNIIM